jgi:DNA-binding MarR family transcriptional regulator
MQLKSWPPNGSLAESASVDRRRLRAKGNTGIYPRMKATCYCAAVRTAARKTTALYDSILEPAGVTLAQFSLLRKVERAGTVSLTKLGQMAELDRSTVGRNVKALEALRLVRLGPARDQREAAVRLTPAGKETLGRAAPLWEEAQRRVEATLGDAEAKQLQALALSL